NVQITGNVSVTPLTSLLIPLMTSIEIHDEEIKACTDTFKVDVSGNTTYPCIAIPTPTWTSGTAYIGITIPTPTWTANVSNNTNGGDGRLSLSDKVAIGIGVGFGVPTILIGLGALLYARRRQNFHTKDSSSPPDTGVSEEGEVQELEPPGGNIQTEL